MTKTAEKVAGFTLESLRDMARKDGFSPSTATAMLAEYDALRAANAALTQALKNVTENMDRAGGDGYGMPECPWCHAEGAGARIESDADVQHDPDCELVLARAALSTARGGG